MICELPGFEFVGNGACRGAAVLRWDMHDAGAPSTINACAAACAEAGDSCVAFEIWGCLATPGTCAGQSCWIMHGQVRHGDDVTVQAAATYYSDPASGNEKCFQKAGTNLATSILPNCYCSQSITVDVLIIRL